MPGKCILEPEFEEGKEYFSEVMPCEMGEAREVTDYQRDPVREKRKENQSQGQKDYGRLRMASEASESYSFKLKSHPDKLLVDHLQQSRAILAGKQYQRNR